MKVALTVWQGRISPVLDAARSVLVVEIENGVARTGREEFLLGESVREKVSRLEELGVEMLVCGAVSRPLAKTIASRGIRLVPFVCGDANEVLEAIAANRIPGTAFSMPGCGCGRRLRGRHGRRGRPPMFGGE